ncbi:MAG: hypothetical protein EOM87_01695, partial [Clostridia bacterium]|nr:hypothetical protein [Clostridia bacterium]
MKKLLILAIIIIALSASFVGCKGVDVIVNTSDLAWSDMPANTNAGLKYFGYYHFGSRIGEVAAMGNSNISKTDARNIDEIAELIEHGFQVFIMIRHIFFKDGKTPSDVVERWEKAKEDIAPYLDNILGFYVDEPMWTGKTESAFHYACQTVRADYPGKKMMAVMALFPAFANTAAAARYFQYCTDLGYDLYLNWDSGVQNMVNRLEDEIAIYNQKIWLIPKGFYRSYDVATYVEDDTIAVGEDVLRWIK